MKSIKTQNQPAYRWSALWPLKLWVRGLYNSWWFCGHKLSIFIYLSMGICHFAKALLDDKKTIKSNFNSLWIQFHFMDHFSVLWITSQFYRSLLSFMDHFSVLWITSQFYGSLLSFMDPFSIWGVDCKDCRLYLCPLSSKYKFVTSTKGRKRKSMLNPDR